MSSTISEKVIVITGASTGIGAAAARQLSAKGASLVLVARREEALRDVAAGVESRAHPIAADVGNRAEVRRVVDGAIARFGRIDVWVNNVGRGISRLPSMLNDEDIDEMIAVNVKTALYGMEIRAQSFERRASSRASALSA